MDNTKTKVLLIEDNPGDARLIREFLTESKDAPFNLEHVDCLSKGLNRIAQGGTGVVLLDLSLPDSQGLDGLSRILAQTQEVPIVVLSGLKDEAVAIKAVHEGAQDYLVKGNIDSSLLVRSLHYAIERQRLRVALRQNEARYRLLADNIADVIWTADLKGRINYVSPSIKNFLGYTVDETLKLEMKDILTPDSVGQAKRLIRDQIALWNPWVKHMPLSLTLEHIRKDGSTVWSDVRLSFLCNEKGHITGILGVTRDITDRKKAEEWISESETQYRSLVETASKAGLGITIVQDMEDKEAVFVFVNDEYCQISGYAREELLGRSSLDTVPPESLASIRERYERRQRGEPLPAYYESAVLRKDGTKVPIETSVSVFNYRGKPATVSFFRDITERRKTEEALRKSEALYRLLADNAADVIWTMDMKGQITYVSPSANRLFGYSVNEMMALKIRQLLTPASADIARKVLEEKLANKAAGLPDSPRSLILEHVRKDGSTVWAEVILSMLRDKQGRLIGVQGVTRDVTERKEAESALRESEARFRTVFEGTGLGIVLVSFDGKALDINPAFEQMLGYNLEEFKVIEGSLKYQHPEDAMVDAKLYIEMLKGKREHYTVDKRYIRKDGAVIWGRQNLSVVRDDKGKPKYFIAMIEDITARGLMEEELRRSEERYRELFENANDIIYIHDLDGNFISINKAGERVTGYTRDEIMSMNITRILPPESLEQARQMIAHKVNKGGRTQYELEIITKHGHRVLLEVSTRLIYEEGKPVGVQGIARNITERKKMEDALRESEERHRLYFENASDVIYSVDPEGTMLSVSPSVERVLGYKPEELIGKNMAELNIVPPEKLEQGLVDTMRALAGERIISSDSGFFAKDGSLKFGEISGAPIFSSDGKVIAAIFVARDITERKRMEEEVRLLSDAVRMSTESMFVASMEGRVVDANEAALKMFEARDRSDLIGKGVLDLIAPEDHEKAFENIKKAIEEGLVKPEEYHFVKKDGSTILIEVSASALKGTDKKPKGFVVMAHDITERKKMEETLRQSEQSYRLLLESTRDAIIVVDAETLKVTFGNRRAAIMFGFDPVLQNGIGVNLLDLVHPEDRDNVVKGFMEDLYQAERRRRYNVRVKTHDGREIWVSALGTRIEYQRRLSVLLSLSDITRDKQIEEEKRRLEEQIQLAGRLAAVGELAAGVAHELNNPITAIKGFAQLLTSKKELEEPLRKDLETIFRESQRAARITQNLLAFARRHEPEKSYISINEALEKTLELRVHQMKLNNIEVGVELDPDLPKTMADFHQMQQVFMNIINNAEQAMIEAHGKGILQIKTQKSGKTIQITFTDDGPGISEENLKRIFDPFFTTKEVGKGTGLGLSICYGLVEAHSGRLYARSKLGEGATFIVEMPIVSEGQPAAKTAVPNPGGKRWKKREERY